MRMLGGFLVVLTIGCSTASTPLPIDFEVNDDPDNARIRVTFTNTFIREVCLLPELWPNDAGKIDQGSDIVFVVVDGERYPILDFNTGYCTGDCARHVKPGETVESFFRYVDFQLPERYYGYPKQLFFDTRAFYCD